ncbi:ATP-binding protein [Promicromonospora kroppenstedtii]|uniref:ATP-binding protein n=1 Tax=Promicromonospora kroppenstedtii TaxID=440482 RepID=A0ABW7XME6_9MICO
MSMIETLWGLVPATSTGQQWVAQTLQLVNWGGYHGHHQVRLSPGATLFSGGSGSGKSTLMDSYIALIMPHTTPFNGASNGGVTGKPRGKEQRNILSYARGKLDEKRVDGETRVRVLRGEKEDTWSAIAMTWADQGGATFTAVRAWYVPSSARTLENVIAVRGTCDGPFDLTALEEAARHRFDRRAVTRTGLTCFDTDRDYTARLHTALGIGAGGDGHKAVGLLGRIQAGQQITTVDALYKTMVLEEPSTFATADGAVQQFDELSATRDRMVTAQQQVRALRPIREHRAAIDDAVERLRMIEAVGQFTDQAAPAALWLAGRRLDLLRASETDLQRRRARARDEATELAVRVAAAKLERDAARDLLGAAGGDRLKKAQDEVDRLEARVEPVAAARARFDALLADVGAQVSDAAGFDAVVEQAHRALNDTDARAAARRRFTEAAQGEQAASDALEELRAELRTVGARKDNIPTDLHRARAALAEAAGLSTDELPFVGELIEVRTEFEPWRAAFNLALGGFATEMLIDVAHLKTFRTAINSVPTARRIRFRGVPTGRRDEATVADRTLPARLDHRPTPFTGWLKQELTDRYGYVCIDSPAQFALHRKAVTISGQTSDGGRGAHGGQGVRNVLGFSAARRLQELEREVAEAEQAHAAASAVLEQATAGLDSFEKQRGAYEKIVDLTWEQVDIASLRSELGRWSAIVTEVTSDNPEIGRLRRELDELEGRVTRLTEDSGVAKSRAAELEQAWERTADAVDTAQRTLDDAEADGTQVAAGHRTYLAGLFADDQSADDSPAQAVERFDAALDRATARVREDQGEAQAAVGRGRSALHDVFETFKERWPNPNLGVDPDTSYDDYERFLTDLEKNGLHELESEWRDSLLRLSGADLTKLDSDISTAVREIRDRIDPVNAILDGLDFSDEHHKLHIELRDTSSPVRARFRSDLRAVREAIANAVSDTDRQRAYTRMAKVVDRVRRTAPEFHDLIDVRNHVRISAEKLTKGGAHVAVYDHIGEKSGGESQELVAFIVGAALRYQLGDAGSARPRYAPVFLDEALIKADAHFTGRAINAWRGLGFQLIIGAPNDKHSGIEPHVDAGYVVLKDTSGKSFTQLTVGLPDEAELPEGATV